MTAFRTLHSRNAHGVAQIHGEALFAPGADLPRWKAQLRERTAAAVIAAAPINKRPRWGHYGKPLKSTIVRSVRTRLTKGGGLIFSAVGSTAHYSAYVNEGTGVFVGNSPWKAKVLPPHQQGSPSLYEHTWKPMGTGRRVSPVYIKGQKGQFFFDKGLKAGLASMRMRTFQKPGEGVSGVASSYIQGFEPNFPGNTEANEAFITSLEQWRAWRDEAWKGRVPLGEGRPLTREIMGRLERKRLFDQIKAERSARLSLARKARRAEAKREQRARIKAEKAKSTRPRPEQIAQAKLDRVVPDYLKWWRSRNKGWSVAEHEAWGFWAVSGNGTRKRIPWPRQIADLYVDAGARYGEGRGSARQYLPKR